MTGDSEVAQPEATERKAGSQAVKVARWVVLGGVGLWLVVGLFGSDDAAPDPTQIRYDAERVCQDEFIANRLKAPGSADYDLTATGGPDTFSVRGTVDAENSFGAKLRSDVACVVTLDGDRWRLDSLSGID